MDGGNHLLSDGSPARVSLNRAIKSGAAFQAASGDRRSNRRLRRLASTLASQRRCVIQAVYTNVFCSAGKLKRSREADVAAARARPGLSKLNGMEPV
ncbi:hypothetical protein EVAR_25599_1 [Eumeta japonica]|uniref:Uncharacterized protein n=1 Tax=Eumeta variegata TaxID=151549 RepID=A0A4C1V2M3_EUMVA|nr:hypothetical protein EVAR_25599_1 [Eumeta japonica]